MPFLGQFFAGMSRCGRAFARNESASPAVEFALVFPIFLGVVLATLQAVTIFLVEAFFESAAEEAARVVLTNQTGALTVTQFQTEVCNQLTALFTCGQVIVELEPLPAGTTNLSSLLPKFKPDGTLASTPPVDVGASAGAAGADMLLVVMYPWPVYGGLLGLNFANLGSGKMLMSSTQVFRIEPKSLS
jgi:Flp pilus assembly protein TadG